MLSWRALLRKALLMASVWVLYYFGVQVGLQVVEPEAGGISLFFPANGLAILVLLRLPIKDWPLAATSIILAYVAAVTPPPRSQGWRYTLGTCTGNVVEIFVAVWGIVSGGGLSSIHQQSISSSRRRLQKQKKDDDDDVSYVFGFDFLLRVLLFGSGVGPAVGAVLGSLGVWWEYSQYVTYWKVLVAWFVGDALPNYMMVYLLSIILVYLQHWIQVLWNHHRATQDNGSLPFSENNSFWRNPTSAQDLSLGLERISRRVELGVVNAVIVFFSTLGLYTNSLMMVNITLLFPALFWSGIRFVPGISALMQLWLGLLVLTLAFYNDGWKWLTCEESVADAPWGGIVTLHISLLVNMGSAAILAVVKFKSDVAALELRRYVEELERARALTTKLEREAEMFTYMSHDLKTPLNAIIGFSQEVIQSEQLSKEGYESMSCVLTAGQGLLGTISRLLDAFRLRGGSAKLTNVWADMQALVNEAVVTMSPLAERKHLELQCNIDPNVDSSMFIDKLRFTQIVFNLLSNAIKFTHKGSVTVNLKKVDVDPHLDASKGLAKTGPAEPDEERGEGSGLSQQSFFVLEVTDTGPGIPEAKQAAIFTKWAGGDWGSYDANDESSIESSSTRKKKSAKSSAGKVRGTGLGLNIVAEIASLMGGCVHLQSVVGMGTTFTVHIPICQGPNGTPSEEIEAPKTMEGLEGLDADMLLTSVDGSHTNKTEYTTSSSNLPLEDSGISEMISVSLQPSKSEPSTLQPPDHGDDNNLISSTDCNNKMAFPETITHELGSVGESLSPKFSPNNDDERQVSGPSKTIAVNLGHAETAKFPPQSSALWELGPIDVERGSTMEASAPTTALVDVGNGSSTAAQIPIATPQLPVTVPPLRILAAEDVKLNQMLLRRQLERLGHSVDMVWDGEECLEALDASAEDPYDVVLLDLMMPNMDGYEVLDELQRRRREVREEHERTGNQQESSSSRFHRVPVIVCSAHLNDEGRNKLLDLGADGLADKPYSIDDFEKHFRRLVTEGAIRS